MQKLPQKWEKKSQQREFKQRGKNKMQQMTTKRHKNNSRNTKIRIETQKQQQRDAK